MSTSISNEINKVIIGENGGITVTPEVNRVIIEGDRIGGVGGSGAGVHSASDKELVMYDATANKLVGTDAFYNPLSREVSFPGAVKVTPGSLKLGEGLTVSSAHETVGYSLSGGRNALSLFAQYDENGTIKPFYYKLDPRVSLNVNRTKNEVIESPFTFNYVTFGDNLTYDFSVVPSEAGELRARFYLGAGIDGELIFDEVKTFTQSDVGNVIVFDVGNKYILPRGTDLFVRFTGIKLMGGIAGPNDLLNGTKSIYFTSRTQAYKKVQVVDEAGVSVIELPEEYNDFQDRKWMTVLDDYAINSDVAYFLCKGDGSTFKNINLTFNPNSQYWAASVVAQDRPSGVWSQRVSFSTDSDWPDNARTFQRAGSTAAIAFVSGFRKFAFEGDIESGQLAIGAHFVGIYNDLQSLTDAIPSPATNYQAIVLTPSEKFYHGVGGQWVELAPVGAIHSTYLGAYDTVQDLESAEPSADNDSLAIVGTTTHAFYIKLNGTWGPIKGTDLPSLTARVGVLEGQTSTLSSEQLKQGTDINANKESLGKLNGSVVAVAIDDNGKLVVTHSDGAKQLINLPAGDAGGLVTSINKAEQDLEQQGRDILKLKSDYGSIDTKVNALEGVYTYSGVSTPIFPNEAKDGYFVNVHDSIINELVMSTPNPSAGNVGGATLHVTNSNPVSTLQLDAVGGDTINESSSFLIPHRSSAFFIYNSGNWVLVRLMPLDSHQSAVTAADIATAVDHGTAQDSGSVKGLDPGWWFIPGDSLNVTGRPPEYKDDISIFRQNLTSGGKTNFAVIMAFGNDNQNKSSMWVQYKNGGNWSPWVRINQSADLTAILADVDKLKRAEPGQLARLDRLESDLGKIYAPSKVVFDAAVNALIDAKIKEKQGEQPKLPTGVPKIYASYGTNFPGTLGDAGIVSSTSGVLNMSNPSKTSWRIFVIVPNNTNQAEDVSGIVVDSSLPAIWQARDITYDGKSYRVFYSPGAYNQETNKVVINFGNQG